MIDFLSPLRAALDLSQQPVVFSGDGALPSTFAVTDLASASIAAAGLATAELLAQQTNRWHEVSVDRRLASFWFATSLRPLGWAVPPLWDPIAGDYPTRDGWIRLHTNAPHHRAAAERVLGHCSDRESMTLKVASWRKHELEHAIVMAGGCAAEMRSWAEWQTHPQGLAVNAEPLILRRRSDGKNSTSWLGSVERPLAGIKVLDLTRVLAGPTASRLLAGLGANVLRIDPLDWNEPGVVPEVTLGKRCTRLDLRDNDDRRTFETLLAEADILLHGYRTDALQRLGYDQDTRNALAPGLIDVCLNAYGWSGPWHNRRGFDSLVQMSCGIAEAGMLWKQLAKPLPLPVQALDHATGYLMAAAAIRALSERLHSGFGSSARLSLARTAKLLIDAGDGHDAGALLSEGFADQHPQIEKTPWGPAHRLVPPLTIGGTPLHWECGANDLGSSPPAW